MASVPLPGTDWTDDERAEIRRLEKVCDAADWRGSFSAIGTGMGALLTTSGARSLAASITAGLGSGSFPA
jgi:hypothetical protein